MTNDKSCGTCKYYCLEDIDNGCVNDQSEYCADWTEHSDYCEEWEGKE